MDAAGAPVAAAKVIDGEQVFAADDEGIVRLAGLPAAEAAVYRVDADGFAPTVFTANLMEAGIYKQLVPVATLWGPFEIDGTTGGSATTGGGAFYFPAGAFFDPETGASAGGTVAITTATAAAGGAPAAMGLDEDGGAVALDALAALFVDARDAGGTALRLMRNRKATLVFELASGTAEDGDELPLRTFDPEALGWREAGSCTVEATPSLRCVGAVGALGWWQVSMPTDLACSSLSLSLTYGERFEIKETFTQVRLCAGGGEEPRYTLRPRSRSAITSIGALPDLSARAGAMAVGPTESDPEALCAMAPSMALNGSVGWTWQIVRTYVVDDSSTGETIKRVYRYESDPISIDKSVPAESAAALRSGPAGVCRSADACTHTKLEITAEDLVLLEPEDADGDEHESRGEAIFAYVLLSHTDHS